MNIDGDPMEVFEREADAKDRLGCIEHRGGDADAEFVGDLRQEIQDECMDLRNYLWRAMDRGWIDQAAYEWAKKDIFSIWFLARVTLDGVDDE